MIRLLEWDSNHFGLNIGQVDRVDYQLEQDVRRLIEQAAKFDCIYLFAQAPLSSVSIKGFSLGKIYFVDHKAQLKRNGIVEDIEISSNLNINIKHVVDPDLYFEKSIEFLISYSRFSKDSGFAKDRIQAMYRVWLEKCKSHGKTYVAFGQDGLYMGMVGYIIDGPKAILNQIIISPEARGKRVGRSLVAYAERDLSRIGVQEYSVDTQLWNKAALDLYFSQGYSLYNHSLVYHWWVREG